ncbi:MAG: sigma-70 family RNA polymerase sigma factor [Bacilli bacterium]|nr:sigma-70 family RNA polymerase sigma factor [Bacilli bacterium]
MTNIFDNDTLFTLSEDETNDLLKKVKNGDKKAKMLLTKYYLKIVEMLATQAYQKITETGLIIEIDDLINNGFIGLMMAIRDFDVNSNIKFKTFAVSKIEEEITTIIFQNNNLLNNCQYNINNVCLNESIEEAYIQKECYLLIREALDILQPHERQIVELYHGFNGKPKTIAEVSILLKMNKFSVRNILKSSQMKLKAYLERTKVIEKRSPKSYPLANYINVLNSVQKASFFARTIVDRNISLTELSKLSGLHSTTIKNYIEKYLPLTNKSLFERYHDTLLQIKKASNKAKLLRRKEKQHLITQ